MLSRVTGPGEHDEDPLESGYEIVEDDPEVDEAEEEVPDVSYMDAIRVWASAAWADGVIVPQEAEAMKRIIEGFPLEDDERATALGWIATRVELDGSPIGEWPYPVRLRVFQAAAEMVACDDEVVESEQAFIVKLRSILRIGIEDAGAFLGPVG